MNDQTNNAGDLRKEAERFHTMITILTLFTRRTTLEWLPEIARKVGAPLESFSVMMLLKIEPDQCLKSLSRNLMAAPSNVSVMIQSMVEKGWVIRMDDPRDRRRVLLRLSAEGEKIYAAIEENLVGYYQEYLGHMEADVIQDLDQATWAMLKVMERMLNRPLLEGES